MFVTRIISFLFLSILLCASFSSAIAQTGKQSVSVLDKAEAEKWREDLRFMAQEMPKRHKNLFHTMTRQQFDDAVKSLDARIPLLARHQVIVELARIVALVGDGHTSINFLFDPKIGFRYYPVALYLYKDGLFVYAADRQYEPIVGGRVVKIGNASAEQALNRVKDLIARDNEMGFKDHAPLLLTAPEVLHAVGLVEDMEKARFVVERQGQQSAVELKPVSATRPVGDNWALGRNFFKLPTWVDARESAKPLVPSSLWLKDPQNYFWFEYLPETRTVYVQYNGIANKENETVADFAKRVFAFVDSNPVDRFVLDLRWNSGGNNYLNKPMLLGIIKSNKIDQRGKLYAVIGRRTFSAAQNLVNDLEKYTNVTFVGEPTAERPNFYADAVRIVLPNSEIGVRASALWWQDLDSRDARQWTGPQIAVELASENYRADSDPVMKTILSYVPRKELAEMLTDALSANDVASAVKLYREFKADSTNAYINTERSMNNLGYRLMEMKRLAHAIKNYERSLELNPANSNAVEMLRKLKAK